MTDRIPHCRDCGYDLRGNPTALRCPECGWSINWKLALRSPPGIHVPRALVAIFLCVALLAIALQVFWIIRWDRILHILHGTRNGTTMLLWARTAWALVTLLHLLQLAATALLLTLLNTRNHLLAYLGRAIAVFGIAGTVAGFTFRLSYMQRHPGSEDGLLFLIAIIGYALAVGRMIELGARFGPKEDQFLSDPMNHFALLWGLEIVGLVTANILAFAKGSAAIGIVRFSEWGLANGQLCWPVPSHIWWVYFFVDLVFWLAVLNGAIVLFALIVRRFLFRDFRWPLTWTLRLIVTLEIGLLPILLFGHRLPWT